MRTRLIAAAAILLGCTVLGATSRPSDEESAKGTVGKLPADWGTHVTVDDLSDELSESVTRMAQNLKRPSDFDKFLKQIHTEGHLTAVLAELLQRHPDTKSSQAADDIQREALALAKAAEAKGAKNFRTAQDAHKKIVELLRKPDGDRAATGTPDDNADWLALGALGDVMKRVEPAYKYIRGKMSNEAAFKKDAETIRHNAAMLYIYSHIAPAFRPTESDMPKLSLAMADASLQLLDALKANDFEKASAANTAINASCNECHRVKRFQKKGSDLDF